MRQSALKKSTIKRHLDTSCRIAGVGGRVDRPGAGGEVERHTSVGAGVAPECVLVVPRRLAVEAAHPLRSRIAVAVAHALAGRLGGASQLTA